MSLLGVSDLQVHYGKINALKGISLTVEAGRLVTLIGANGAGKTTLLNTISGAIPGSSGSITFKGEEILNDEPHRITRRGIAHVPEGRKIFSELTVEENLEVGAYIQRDRAKVKELIERNYQLFPVSPSGRGRREDPCREVSSRCLRSPGGSWRIRSSSSSMSRASAWRRCWSSLSSSSSERSTGWESQFSW
jgi:ABC-type branched-subunit amino acid transport system ATPase component